MCGRLWFVALTILLSNGEQMPWNAQGTLQSLKLLRSLLLAIQPSRYLPKSSALRYRGGSAGNDPSAERFHMRENGLPQNVELTYFDIKAMPGEKLRLALALAGIPFKDNRIKFPDWPELKPKTKYGQLPILKVDGKEMYQSGSLLRWIGSLGDSCLYPLEDRDKVRVIEEVLGISDDLQRAFTPALYMGMAHTNFGHPEDWPEKGIVLKRMREEFVSQELPKYMKFLTDALERSGAFLTGDRPTIADCQLLPQLVSLTAGVVDHIPADCLKDYPAVTAWMDRMLALPDISKFYSQQAS